MGYLVTGGTGFIGAQVVRKLVEQGNEVVIFDISRNTRFLADILDDITVVQGNVANFDEVFDTVKTYEVTRIFHTAALLSGSTVVVPLKTARVNGLGIANVLEASRMMDVERIVFTSTVGVFTYGLTGNIDDDSEKYPISPYGATKVMGELYGLWYQRTYGLDFRGVRFSLVYGSGDPYAYHERSRIIENPALGKPAEFTFSENVIGNWLYVKDAANALLLLMTTEPEKVKQRIYNIGGMNATMRHVADIVQTLIPEAVITFTAEPSARRGRRLFDTYAQNELGWKPVYTLEEGIQETIELTRSNPQLYSEGRFTRNRYV
jgi:UDP-glucose 4-epimerase